MAAVTVLTLKPLAEGVIVSATTVGTAVTIYANTSGEDCTVKNITAYNQHTGAIKFYLLRTPDSAGSVGTPDINDIIWSALIPAKGTLTLGYPDLDIQLNDTNDTVKAYCDTTANKVHVWLTGWVYPTA